MKTTVPGVEPLLEPSWNHGEVKIWFLFDPQNSKKEQKDTPQSDQSNLH